MITKQIYHNKEKKKSKHHHIKITNYDDFLLKKEFKYGNPVYLNIYHLSFVNFILQIFGIGLYHTTIEVQDLEYSFGSTNEEVAGIFTNKAGTLSTRLRLKETIYLGSTLYNTYTIYKLLSNQYPYWLGSSYDPFVKNCNHFSKFFARLILNHQVIYPDYVNRLSKYGMMFTSFYPPIKRLYGEIVLQVTNNNLKCIQNTSEQLNNQEVAHINSKEDIDTVRKGNNNSSNTNINVGEEQKEMINRESSNNLDIKKDKEFDIIREIIESNPILNISNYIETDDKDILMSSIVKEISHLGTFRDNIKEEEILLTLLNKVNNNIEKINKESKIKIKEQKLSLPSDYLKLSICHHLFQIYFEEKNISKQESILNEILNIEQNDVYAMIYLAFIRYQQFRFPEFQELLRNASSACDTDSYLQKYIDHFQELLNNL